MTFFTLIKQWWDSKGKCQKIGYLLGLVVGIILAIVLIKCGIAAIPYTGGLSVLGTFVFGALIVGSCMSSCGYMGKALDLAFDREKPTWDKIFALGGCIVGFCLSITSIFIHPVSMSFVLAPAVSALFSKLIPLMVFVLTGQFASLGSYLGRNIDNLWDFVKSIYNYLFSNKPKQDNSASGDYTYTPFPLGLDSSKSSESSNSSRMLALMQKYPTLKQSPNTPPSSTAYTSNELIYSLKSVTRSAMPWNWKILEPSPSRTVPRHRF